MRICNRRCNSSSSRKAATAAVQNGLAAPICCSLAHSLHSPHAPLAFSFFFFYSRRAMVAPHNTSISTYIELLSAVYFLIFTFCFLVFVLCFQLSFVFNVSFYPLPRTTTTTPIPKKKRETLIIIIMGCSSSSSSRERK